MEKPDRKQTLTGIMLILVCTGTLTVAGLMRFWGREYTGNEFQFTYIPPPPPEFSGFVTTTWENYKSQIEVIALSDTRKTMITITKNTYSEPLLMDCTFTSTAEGARLEAQGQYMYATWNSGVRVVTLVGDPFIIPTDGTTFILDTSQMEWDDWGIAGSHAGVLEITFVVDKAGIVETTSGTYTFDVTLGIGTE